MQIFRNDVLAARVNYGNNRGLMIPLSYRNGKFTAVKGVSSLNTLAVPGYISPADNPGLRRKVEKDCIRVQMDVKDIIIDFDTLVSALNTEGVSLSDFIDEHICSSLHASYMRSDRSGYDLKACVHKILGSDAFINFDVKGVDCDELCEMGLNSFAYDEFVSQFIKVMNGNAQTKFKLFSMVDSRLVDIVQASATYDIELFSDAEFKFNDDDLVAPVVDGLYGIYKPRYISTNRFNGSLCLTSFSDYSGIVPDPAFVRYGDITEHTTMQLYRDIALVDYINNNSRDITNYIQNVYNDVFDKEGVRPAIAIHQLDDVAVMRVVDGVLTESEKLDLFHAGLRKVTPYVVRSEPADGAVQFITTDEERSTFKLVTSRDIDKLYTRGWYSKGW